MEENQVLELWVRDASTRDSNIALRKAVEAVAAGDPEFHARVIENGVQYIVDASPGCMRLPMADAERVVKQLRSAGHDVASRNMSLAFPTSSRARSSARRNYLAKSVEPR